MELFQVRSNCDKLIKLCYLPEGHIVLSAEDAIESAKQCGISPGESIAVFDEDEDGRPANERQAAGEPLGWLVTHINGGEEWLTEPMYAKDAP